MTCAHLLPFLVKWSCYCLVHTLFKKSSELSEQLKNQIDIFNYKTEYYFRNEELDGSSKFKIVVHLTKQYSMSVQKLIC